MPTKRVTRREFTLNTTRYFGQRVNVYDGKGSLCGQFFPPEFRTDASEEQDQIIQLSDKEAFRMEEMIALMRRLLEKIDYIYEIAKKSDE